MLFTSGNIPYRGVEVVIHRVIPITQLLDLEEGGPLPPEMLESSFDKMTYIIQQIDNAVKRCLNYPITIAHDFDFTMPAPRSHAILGISVDSKSFALYDYSLKLQYSPDIEHWYDESLLDRNDRYVRLSIDGGQTWGSPIDLNGLQNMILEKTKEYRDNAMNSATAAHISAMVAQDSAAVAFGTSASVWNAFTVYSFPDVVAYIDGHTYRCRGECVGPDQPPVVEGVENTTYWTRLTLAYGNIFEYDENQDLMPAMAILFPWIGPFELDENGDIMPPDMPIEFEWIDGLSFRDVDLVNAFEDGGTFEGGM